jgi:hypothetical protein
MPNNILTVCAITFFKQTFCRLYILYFRTSAVYHIKVNALPSYTSVYFINNNPSCKFSIRPIKD